MRSISYHIMPLVINNLEHGHTNTHTHTHTHIHTHTHNTHTQTHTTHTHTNTHNYLLKSNTKAMGTIRLIISTTAKQ